MRAPYARRRPKTASQVLMASRRLKADRLQPHRTEAGSGSREGLWRAAPVERERV